MQTLATPEKTKSSPAVALQKNKQASFFAPVQIQPKLSIGAADDPAEKEADAIADRVMRMPVSDNANTFFKPVATSLAQRKCADCEEEKLQRKENSSQTSEVSSETSSYINSLSSKGSYLSKEAKSFFEPRFGQDFSNVKIHTDTVAAKSADSINALAYTTGNNIVFNQNQFSPESNGGKRLLAHELTHVVQQNNGNIFKKVISRKMGDGHDLTALRFSGDEQLEDCYDGKKVFKKGDMGTSVGKIQSALLDAGFPLPKNGVNENYGSETARAVRLFQGAVGFKGSHKNGKVNAETMEALDVRFSTNPSKTIDPRVPTDVSYSHEFIAFIKRLPFLKKVTDSEGFKALNGSEQIKFLIYIDGIDPYISKPALDDFEPKFTNKTFDDTKVAEFRTYLKTQPGAIAVSNNGPDFVKDIRKSNVVSGPQKVKKFHFLSGKAKALKYQVTIDKTTVPVWLPETPNPKNGIFHSINDVANALSILPALQLSLVKGVYVEPKSNPDDSYWKKEYKDPNFRSYMTAGAAGIINIYPLTGAVSQEAMDTSIIHETGHIISQQRFGGNDKVGVDWANWKRAAADDIIFVSKYSLNSMNEDFAETMALFSQVDGTIFEQQIRALMPERAKILDTIRSPKKH